MAILNLPITNVTSEAASCLTVMNSPTKGPNSMWGAIQCPAPLATIDSDVSPLYIKY